MEYNFDEKFFDEYRQWKHTNEDKCLICGNPRYNKEYICYQCRNKQYAMQKSVYKEIEDNSLYKTVNGYILDEATDNYITALLSCNEVTTTDLLKIVAMAYMQKYDYFFDGLYGHLPINIYILTHTKQTNKISLTTDANPPVKRCIDGHMVRSTGEVEIDNWLYKNNLTHAYESKYQITNDTFYLPDFYVPKLKLYIEYFGLNDERYKLKTKEKIETYSKDNKYHFIYIYPNDKITDKLQTEITKIINKTKKQ